MTSRFNRLAILASFAASLAAAQTSSGPLALRSDDVSIVTGRPAEAATVSGQAITLKAAVALALKHSTGLAIAQADQKIADRNLAQAKYAFLPQLTVGSGLGYSNGFPLSLENLAPSLLNVTSSSYIVNLGQQKFIEASRHQLNAMTKMADERRAQVVYDTALAYSQLDSLVSSMNSLRQEQQAATRVQTVSQQRTQAGVDSPVELTKAKLSLARVRLSMEESQGQEDLLRAKLSQLTGLPAEQIETVSGSIPALPVPVDAREFLPRVLETNHDIQVANEQALAKEATAKGEHRSMWPQMDYALQYAALAHYNNYDVYFRRETFQRSNVTVGAVIRFPIFSPVQSARAQAADYEALKARKQAEEVKDQVTSEAMKLNQSVRQLAAARDVAQLEYQLASSDVQTVQAHLEVGQATVRDQENAHLAERQKFTAYMQANFEVEKVLMQLLYSSGEIESWATSGK